MSTEPTPAVLTADQQRVFDLLIQGNSNQQIAASIERSEKTVKSHVTVLLKLFKCDSRCRLVARHYRGEL